MVMRGKTLTVKAVLLAYEAPLVVLAHDNKDKSYIGINYADGEESYLFYFVRVSPDDLQKLYQQRIDVRYVATKLRIGAYYLGETWGDVGDSLSTTGANEIKPEYLPLAGMFIPDCEAFAGSTLKSVHIDGRWGIEDMRRFSDLVQDSYAFVYALSGRGAASTKQKMGELFRRYPWRGGFSSVNFFDDLYRLIPSNERAEIRSIQYASPGAIKLQMNGEVAELIRSFVQDLNVADSSALKAYTDARTYLRSKGWLGKAKVDLELLAQDNTMLLEYVKVLCKAFGLSSHVDEVVQFSGSDPLGAVKILLAYYRRLAGLADYVATGKAQELFAPN